MLTEKQHLQQIKRLEKIVKPWSSRLGLFDWEADVIVTQHELGVSALDENANVLASCSASWPYKAARLEFSGPGILRIDDDDLERAVVHELMHCKVNEMAKGEGVDPHEERVVTDLTNATIWTYYEGVRDGRKAALKEMKARERGPQRSEVQG